MLKRNLLVATALASIYVGSGGVPVYANNLADQIKEIGKDLRSGANHKAAQTAAPVLVELLEKNVLRATNFKALTESGRELRVIDTNTPVFTKLVGSIFETVSDYTPEPATQALLQTIGSTIKAVTQIPVVKNYVEFKIKETLTGVAANHIEVVLENTDILKTATATGNLAAKALGFAKNAAEADDIRTAEFKRISQFEKEMKSQLSVLFSKDEKAAHYCQNYFDMLVRRTVRSYLIEATEQFIGLLTKDALNVLEVKLNAYAVKTAGAAGFAAGGALGFATGGGIGAAFGGATGRLAADLAAQELKGQFLSLIEPQRQKQVKILAETLGKTVLPLTAFEVMRPDIGLTSKSEALAIDSSDNEWIEVSADKNIAGKVIVVPEDKLTIADDWEVITIQDTPGFMDYTKAAVVKSKDAIPSIATGMGEKAKNAYAWIAGAAQGLLSYNNSFDDFKNKKNEEVNAKYAESTPTVDEDSEIDSEIYSSAVTYSPEAEKLVATAEKLEAEAKASNDPLAIEKAQKWRETVEKIALDAVVLPTEPTPVPTKKSFWKFW